MFRLSKVDTRAAESEGKLPEQAIVGETATIEDLPPAPALLQKEPGDFFQQGVLLLEDRPLPRQKTGLAVLLVYCLHNGWNCWTFLNASSDVDSAKSLLGVSESEIGMLNTAGLLAILVFLLLATVCKWPRLLLWFGAVLNLASPVLRFYGARMGNYGLVLVSFVGNGAAYGTLAVWPPIISSVFFRENRHALSTAAAMLSNWLGGALAALLTPVLTDGTGDGLLKLLQVQAYICIGLALLTICWLWIPDVAANSSLSLWSELQACCKFPVSSEIFCFGIVTGIAIGLQNANPMLLVGVGVSEVNAGIGNCLFQIAGAVIGVGLGAFVTCRRHLQQVIRCLHGVALLAFLSMFPLCWMVSWHHGRDNYPVVALLTILTVLGVSVVGLLPFVVQQAVYSAHPATENFVCGIVVTIGTAVGAGVTQLSASIPAISAVAFLTVVMSLQTFFFTWLDCRFPSAAF